MADREVAAPAQGVPEIDENLEAVLLYAIGEARTRIEEGEDLVPFTALVVGDTVFLESHPAETAEECFNQARHTVQGAQGAACYALCYDGYVDTDEGQKDALIAEGGLPGQLEGQAVGLLYTETEEDLVFDAEVLYIGTAPNFMMGLKPDAASDDSAIKDEAQALAEADD